MPSWPVRCAVFLASWSVCAALFEGLYCGTESCYDVLEVSRDVSKAAVAQSYRKLARKWHPDLHRGEAAKKEAEGQFQRIATAYEILRDDESRADYDYMLDNPDKFYYNYYKYYRRRVGPQVDIRVVIAGVITAVSLVQYYSAWTNYNAAIKYLLSNPKYRSQAMEVAAKQNLLDASKKKSRDKTKEQQKLEQEEVLKKILEEKMDIKGGYRRPKMTDVLWIQLFVLPYHVAIYVAWYARWVYKFTIKKEEYGDEEKLYLIMRLLGVKGTQWEAIEDSTKQDYLKQRLWTPHVFREWKAEQEAEMKARLAESSRFKMYRRYMKNNKSQMTFGPE